MTCGSTRIPSDNPTRGQEMWSYSQRDVENSRGCPKTCRSGIVPVSPLDSASEMTPPRSQQQISARPRETAADMSSWT